MSDTVIEVNKVSKVFSKNYRSARHQLKQMFVENFFECEDKSELSKDEFWALRDISFSVNKNETLAILGANGSGKSTLLKMLNGIYMPDEGEIHINGNISSVLELSTGFKSDLTGLENIYLKFSILGKNKEFVDEILENVINFSELSEFMDTPLKHYSSGMKSKLGFAIASSMNSEILILDEVFAAGDKNFKVKSKARIQELCQNTTTIIVTHNMSIVKDLADRVIVLNKGRVLFDGNPNSGINVYNNLKKPNIEVSSIKSSIDYSIVTPVYNVEKYLDKYFESLIEQTLSFENNIYLILVDDGSTDKSAEIIKNYEKKFPKNIKYIKKENGGVSSARNVGMQYVKTPWFTMIDPDDMVNETYFEEVDKCVVGDKSIDMVSCNIIFYIDETAEYKNHFLSYRFKAEKKVVNPSNMQNYIQSTVNSVFFKSSVIEKYQMNFDEKIVPVFEDGCFINQLFIEDKNINIAYLKEAKYFYRKRLDNSSIVNSAWQKPGRYLDAIEYGLLDLFVKAKVKDTNIPVYIQRFVLYQVQFYYKRIVNDGDKLEFLSQEQLILFQELLYKLFSYIDSETIETCALGGLWHKYRVGFYNLYKDKTIFKHVCYLDGYNSVNKKLKLHYYTHSDTKEEFFLNDKVLKPSSEEIIEHYFFDQLFVYEKVIYIPLVGEWEYFDVKLGGIETQISLNAKRYKTGIQVNNLINTPIKD